jgi:hypothetical protein
MYCKWTIRGYQFFPWIRSYGLLTGIFLPWKGRLTFYFVIIHSHDSWRPSRRLWGKLGSNPQLFLYFSDLSCRLTNSLSYRGDYIRQLTEIVNQRKTWLKIFEWFNTEQLNYLTNRYISSNMLFENFLWKKLRRGGKSFVLAVKKKFDFFLPLLASVSFLWFFCVMQSNLHCGEPVFFICSWLPFTINCLLLKTCHYTSLEEIFLLLLIFCFFYKEMRTTLRHTRTWWTAACGTG